MNTIIYGVDTSRTVNPIMVRDAIIDCFVKAHSEVLESMKDPHDFNRKDFDEMKHMDVEMLIKAQFNDADADFDHPSKGDLFIVLDKLREFAANFRKPAIIKKHYGEIMLLMNKLS